MFDYYRVPSEPDNLKSLRKESGGLQENEFLYEIIKKLGEISIAGTTYDTGESARRYKVRTTPNKKSGKSSDRIKAEANYFIEKLVRLVPSEAVALYLFAQGLIGKDRPVTLIVWSLFCLFIAGLVRYIGTKDAMNKSVQLGAIFIACVSFIIWLYNIGGPFLLIPSLHDPVIASLMIAGWTTLTTLLYKP